MPLEAPYSDKEGNLDLMLATADGKSAGLFKIPTEGSPSYHPIELTTAISPQPSLQWLRDESLMLAWLSTDSKEVFAASADLSGPPARITPRKVFSSAAPIANLTLAQRYNQGRQVYEGVLVLLGLDRAREGLQIRRVGRTGVVESNERFTLPGLQGMAFFETALREDLTPVYSFFDGEGGLWVAQPRVGRMTPVSDSAGNPVTRDCRPHIVLPSRSSKVPGVYIRYIDGGKRLAVVKVG